VIDPRRPTVISLDKAEARERVKIADAEFVAKLRETDRSVHVREEVEDQYEQSPLILDGYRRRPRYFDGKFLTGADLTRDQDYVRQRQADMARAAGGGVITGLRVSNRSLSRGQTLSISPGVGLTPSGDVVMLSARRNVPLLDLPTSRQLDAALGLSEEPRVPLQRRTGLFILALRPVEFTANPIAAYPRTITGKRTVEDGDIIEASAITLIPYPDMSGAADINEARRKVARSIFAGRGGTMPQDALPLAMLGLDRGTVRWVDTAMVRRETGADSGVHAMFAGRPRAIAEAFVLQHQAHLNDILADMAGRGIPPVFPAASAFSLLPPTGPMPLEAIQQDNLGFTQLYFPPGVDVDLAFAPTDEISALAEESLALPPNDLEAAPGDLDAVGVTILIPVDRPRYQRLRTTLGGANLVVASNVASPSAASAFDLVSDIVARRKAAEASARDASAAAAAEAEALRTQAWRAALTEAASILPQATGGSRLVWYTRRRSIAQQPRVTGTGVTLSSDDVSRNALVNANLDRLKLAKRLAAINGEATPQATVRLMSLLGSAGVANSDVMTVSVISDIEKVMKEELPDVPPPPPPPQPAATVQPMTPMMGLPPGMRELLARHGAMLVPATPIVSPDLAAARSGFAMVAAANAAGVTTAAREDTPLKLGESEVMNIAQDYSDTRLGEGLHRAASTIDAGWPSAKDAVWLGESGKAPAVDLAFRAVGEEKVGDFANLLKTAVSGQDAKALDELLAKMA
jgi:hypothetical protein